MKEEMSTLYVNLREHFDKLWVEREKLLDEKFRSNKEAIHLAREQVDHRLEGMNEFQKRIDRLEGTFVTQTSLKLSLNEIVRRLSFVEKAVYIGIGGFFIIEIATRFFLK